MMLSFASLMLGNNILSRKTSASALKMSSLSKSPLMDVGTLAKCLNDVKVVDASWHLSDRDGKKEFIDGHIPNARFFDIDRISDKGSNLPHMLPRADQFGAHISEMGISNDDKVVVYTAGGCFSASRCWWTFKIFGHKNVFVLNGGLPAWIESGREIERGDFPSESTSPPKNLVETKGNSWLLNNKGYQAKLVPSMVKTWNQVLQVSESCQNRIIDARSKARFDGKAPEPRAGLASGHIPNSVCVPFTAVLAEGDFTRFRSPDEIKNVFESAGVDINSAEPLITTCGSGVTASVLTFALHLVGRDCGNTPVYDGSWSEWGSRSDLPVSV